MNRFTNRLIPEFVRYIVESVRRAYRPTLIIAYKIHDIYPALGFICRCGIIS